MNATMDVYDRQHAPSLKQTHQRTGSDSSGSDITPKSIPIPLPETPFGHSRVGNNSWKNLGQLEPVGPNGMRGVLEAAASQQIATNQNTSSPGNQPPGNKIDPKKTMGNKGVSFPVPTRKAPPPPARPTSSSHISNQGPSSSNELDSITQDVNEVIQSLIQVIYLLTRFVKTKKGDVNVRQPTN